MGKKAAQIKEGLTALANHPNELISGTVVSGSVNTSEYTVSVQPTDGSEPIEGVLLNVIAGNANGMVLIPKDDSNVIIGSIDGPGEWSLIKTSDIDKVLITIGNVVYEMNESQINIQNGSVVFNIGASIFKMNTAGESLFQFLNDLVTAITLLTVGTSGGASTVPVNVATFNTLLTRLSNLLSA